MDNKQPSTTPTQAISSEPQITRNFKHSYLLTLLFTAYGFIGWSLGIGFSLQPYMIISVIILLFSINKMKIAKFTKYETLLFVFFLYFMATALQFRYAETNARFVAATAFSLLMFLVIRSILFRYSISKIENCIKYSGIIVSCAFLFYYLMGLIDLGFNFHGSRIISHGVMIDRSTPRLIGFMLDPNLTVLVLSFFFHFFYGKKDLSLRRTGIILSGLCIMLTMSRGGILAMVVSIIVISFVKHRNKFRILHIFKLLIVFALIYLLIMFLDIEVLNILLSRLSTIVDGDQGGRNIIWQNAWQTFQNYPIFGIGIFSWIPYNIERFGSPVYIHNTFLEVLVESGIIGAVFFGLFLFSFIKHSYNFAVKNEDNFFLLGIVISMLLQMLFLSLLLNAMLFLIVALVSRYLLENTANRDDKPVETVLETNDLVSKCSNDSA